LPLVPVLTTGQPQKEALMGKGIILWLMGVPLSVILLIALFTTWI